MDEIERLFQECAPDGVEIAPTRPQTIMVEKPAVPPPTFPEPILASQPDSKALRNALTISLLVTLGVIALSMIPDKEFNQLTSWLSTVPEEQKVAALAGIIGILILANIRNLTQGQD